LRREKCESNRKSLFGKETHELKGENPENWIDQVTTLDGEILLVGIKRH
jgi:hypothetical protein